MKKLLHELIHILAQFQKEENLQRESAARKQMLLDKAGRILEEFIEDDTK